MLLKIKDHGKIEVSYRAPAYWMLARSVGDERNAKMKVHPAMLLKIKEGKKTDSKVWGC